MFEYVDEFFAETVLKQYPEALSEHHTFLATLFKQSREGAICIAAPQEALPSFFFANLLHKEGNRIYLKRNWECEKRFLEHLQRIKNFSCEPVTFDLEKISLLPEQKNAVKKALTNPLTLIVGGPGCGKSFTAATLVSHFPKKIAVCAPTGKATAHLRTKIKKEGVIIKTLHALLKEKYLPFDLLVVDEGSMIDAGLMTKLFSAVKKGARVVILGDSHQLPPVESGSFFADLVERAPECVARLTTSQRTDLKEILELAANVNLGKSVPVEPLPTPQKLLQFANEKWFAHTTPDSLFAALHDFRILTPLKFGPYGSRTLNTLFYEEHRDFMDSPYIPVMIVENDDYLGLYNGDIGLLKGEKILFEDQRVILAARCHYEYAYALTIHKAQGSEYGEVVVLLPEEATSFGRELLYTAITRAKKKVTLYGTPETVKEIVERRVQRLSGI